MPTKIKSFTARKRGPKSKWAKIFDACTPGQPWLLVRGQHIPADITTDAVRAAAWSYAKRNNLRARVSAEGNSDIQLEFISLEN